MPLLATRGSGECANTPGLRRANACCADARLLKLGFDAQPMAASDAGVVVNTVESCAAFLRLFQAKSGLELSVDDQAGLVLLLQGNSYQFEATLNDCAESGSPVEDDSVLRSTRFSAEPSGKLALQAVNLIRAHVAPTFGKTRALVNRRAASSAVAEVLESLKSILGRHPTATALKDVSPGRHK